jgi:hypothetical protein
MIFRPSSLNFPCGLGIANLDKGREPSENKENNNKIIIIILFSL